MFEPRLDKGASSVELVQEVLALWFRWERLMLPKAGSSSIHLLVCGMREAYGGGPGGDYTRRLIVPEPRITFDPPVDTTRRDQHEEVNVITGGRTIREFSVGESKNE